MTVELTLNVNNNPIHTDYFVQSFIDHTVCGMIESLEGTGKVKDLNLIVDGENVNLSLNGEQIPTNYFASKIIRATVFGMVSVLKGVADTKKLSISIHK